MDRISIYVPQSKRDQKPLERLQKVAKNHDRSLNYLVIQAILEFVEREEKRKK